MSRDNATKKQSRYDILKSAIKTLERRKLSNVWNEVVVRLEEYVKADEQVFSPAEYDELNKLLTSVMTNRGDSSEKTELNNALKYFIEKPHGVEYRLKSTGDAELKKLISGLGKHQTNQKSPSKNIASNESTTNIVSEQPPQNNSSALSDRSSVMNSVSYTDNSDAQSTVTTGQSVKLSAEIGKILEDYSTLVEEFVANSAGNLTLELLSESSLVILGKLKASTEKLAETFNGAEPLPPRAEEKPEVKKFRKLYDKFMLGLNWKKINQEKINQQKINQQKINRQKINQQKINQQKINQQTNGTSYPQHINLAIKDLETISSILYEKCPDLAEVKKREARKKAEKQARMLKAKAHNVVKNSGEVGTVENVKSDSARSAVLDGNQQSRTPTPLSDPDTTAGDENPSPSKVNIIDGIDFEIPYESPAPTKISFVGVGSENKDSQLITDIDNLNNYISQIDIDKKSKSDRTPPSYNNAYDVFTSTKLHQFSVDQLLALSKELDELFDNEGLAESKETISIYQKKVAYAMAAHLQNVAVNREEVDKTPPLKSEFLNKREDCLGYAKKHLPEGSPVLKKLPTIPPITSKPIERDNTRFFQWRVSPDSYTATLFVFFNYNQNNYRHEVQSSFDEKMKVIKSHVKEAYFNSPEKLEKEIVDLETFLKKAKVNNPFSTKKRNQTNQFIEDLLKQVDGFKAEVKAQKPGKDEFNNGLKNAISKGVIAIGEDVINDLRQAFENGSITSIVGVAKKLKNLELSEGQKERLKNDFLASNGGSWNEIKIKIGQMLVTYIEDRDIDAFQKNLESFVSGIIAENWSDKNESQLKGLSHSGYLEEFRHNDKSLHDLVSEKRNEITKRKDALEDQRQLSSRIDAVKPLLSGSLDNKDLQDLQDFESKLGGFQRDLLVKKYLIQSQDNEVMQFIGSVKNRLQEIDIQIAINEVSVVLKQTISDDQLVDAITELKGFLEEPLVKSYIHQQVSGNKDQQLQPAFQKLEGVIDDVKAKIEELSVRNLTRDINRLVRAELEDNSLKQTKANLEKIMANTLVAKFAKGDEKTQLNHEVLEKFQAAIKLVPNKLQAVEHALFFNEEEVARQNISQKEVSKFELMRSTAEQSVEKIKEQRAGSYTADNLSNLLDGFKQALDTTESNGDEFVRVILAQLQKLNGFYAEREANIENISNHETNLEAQVRSIGNIFETRSKDKELSEKLGEVAGTLIAVVTTDSIDRFKQNRDKLVHLRNELANSVHQKPTAIANQPGHAGNQHGMFGGAASQNQAVSNQDDKYITVGQLQDVLAGAKSNTNRATFINNFRSKPMLPRGNEYDLLLQCLNNALIKLDSKVKITVTRDNVRDKPVKANALLDEHVLVSEIINKLNGTDDGKKLLLLLDGKETGNGGLEKVVVAIRNQAHENVQTAEVKSAASIPFVHGSGGN